LNPDVGSELSSNFQDTTIWDKINANRRIGLNHCETMSKELRIDIFRLPTRNSEEPILSWQESVLKLCSFCLCSYHLEVDEYINAKLLGLYNENMDR
jgi:hypothetical protein